MSISAAALAAMAAAGIGNNLLSTGLNAGLNYWLQKDAQNFSAKEASLNRDFNSTEAQKARDFTKVMSSSEIQRKVADMQAAGINPAAINGVAGSGTVASPAASNNSFSSSAGHIERSSPYAVDKLITSALKLGINKLNKKDNSKSGMSINGMALSDLDAYADMDVDF